MNNSDEFQVEAVKEDIQLIDNPLVRNGLMNVTEQCESPENHEFTITGPLAGLVNIDTLLCIQNRFERVILCRVF